MSEDGEARRREIAELRSRLEALERAERAEPTRIFEPPPAEDKLLVQVQKLSSPPEQPSLDNDTRRFIVIVGVVLAVLVLLAMCTMPKREDASEDVPGTAQSASPPVVEPQSLPKTSIEPTYAWRYSEETDELTDKAAYHSCVDSTSRVELNWPYKSQYPRLCVRQSPKFGRDVIISLIEGGQFICTSYDGCTAKVRFDDGAIQSFTMLEPADHSSNVLFIGNDARFVAAMRRAKRVRISASFYEAGEQTMDFPVEGFDTAKAGIK